MTRRCPTILLCLAALAATLRAAPEPAQSAPPGATPADNTSAPLAAGKNSDSTSAAVTFPTENAATSDAHAKGKSKLMPADLAKALPAPPPLSPRFLQVRTRISALFDIRNDPPPPPDPRLNPFRPPGAMPPAPVASAATATPAEGVAEPVPAGNNLALLQQAVARINVRGIVQRTNPNRYMVSISTGPGKLGIYGEGDVISVNLSPEPAPVRIHAVKRNSVTFKLGDAEMVLSF